MEHALYAQATFKVTSEQKLPLLQPSCSLSMFRKLKGIYDYNHPLFVELAIVSFGYKKQQRNCCFLGTGAVLVQGVCRNAAGNIVKGDEADFCYNK